MFFKSKSHLLLSNIVKMMHRDRRKIELLYTQRIDRFLSEDSVSNKKLISFSDRYTEDQQSFILDKINKYTADELIRYNITELRLKKLIAHRSKNGHFESLNDLYLMQGIDWQVIDKLCQSIIKGEVEQKPRPIIANNDVLTPPLNGDIRNAIQTFTGIRVYGSCISWAQIDVGCNLMEWEWHSFEDKPLKDGVITVVEAVANIISNVPPSDAYIMENDPIIPFSRMNSASYYLQLQRQQIIGTIVSLLGTREPPFGDPSESWNLINNIYMMRSRTPARLFDLLIGTEIVSAQSTVKKMIDKGNNNFDALIRIHVDPAVKESYESRDIYQQEQMNWALLLTSAFIDISILRNNHLKSTRRRQIKE